MQFKKERRRKQMKLGLCRCLLQYYKLNTILETFLKELGVDYIFSDETNQKILEDSLRIAEDENCLPVKLIFGHVLNLKDRCERVLIARVISLDAKSNTCPRLLLLPELVSLLLGVKVLKFNINVKSYPLFFSFLYLGLKLDRNFFKVILAYRKAKKAYQREMEDLKKEREVALRGEKLKVALLGHPYLLFDRFLNLRLLERLKKEVELLYPEMAEEVKNLPFIYWGGERLTLNAAYYFSKKVDGLIWVTSFLCGTSALCREFIFTRAKEAGIPVLELVIDEDLTETALDTRIQAFLNMLRRRRLICNTF